MIAEISSSTGIDAPVLRLLLSVLSTYPLGWLYRTVFLTWGKPSGTWGEALRHAYCLLSGAVLAYFNYGLDAGHFVAAIGGSWLILRLFGPSFAGAALVFIYAFGYLLTGYYFYATESYDVDWTTSYCVICLRIIGFAMDYYDGRKRAGKDKESGGVNNEGLDAPTPETPVTPMVSDFPTTDRKSPTSDIKSQTLDTSSSNVVTPRTVSVTDTNGKPSTKSALRFSWEQVELSELPSLLETFGYCFFFGGFLVGPQFPFAIYKRFITMQLFGNDKDATVRVPSGNLYAARCFLLGLIYMALTQLGKIYFRPWFVVEPAFAMLPYWQRYLYMTVAGRVVLYKYLGVWLLNEGGCVLSGISFKGYDPKTSKPLWDGLANVMPAVFEYPTSFADVISSFNMNTNLWCKNYIFKRLRFLGNKTLSGLGALLFLAIWHGFAPGYFFAFTIEFLDVEAERHVRTLLEPVLGWMYDRTDSKRYSSWSAIVGRALNSLVSFFFVYSFLSYGAVSFDLLTWSRVKIFGNALWYASHVAVAVAFLLSFLLAPKKRGGKRELKEKKDK